MIQPPNIEFKKTSKNPTLDSKTSMFEIPFYKDIEYFSNLENFVSFVKAVEKMVRTSNYYRKYISELKEEVGLTYCQVLSNIDDESANIEMHHGPILTLFDYVAIITDYMLYHRIPVTSFSVATRVIQEHYDHNVQVVMLSKTVHELVHEDDIFINFKQAFGNLNRFLEKYRDGINKDQINKINRYIALCHKYNSFDKDTLKLNDNLKEWSKSIIF